MIEFVSTSIDFTCFFSFQIAEKKQKQTPSKIPRYDVNKGKNIHNDCDDCDDSDERSPIMRFIPISGHANSKGPIKIPSFSTVNNRNTHNNSANNDDCTPKTTLTSSPIQMSPDKTMDRMDDKSTSPKKPRLQLTDDVHESKCLSIDSKDSNNNIEIDDIPVANRRPTRRAAPKDLREPLLKAKMRRESKREK